tara:strand:- start:564 stop:1688 length:1125 start_codon:yes stop_codon:yes gene_type:complete
MVNFNNIASSMYAQDLDNCMNSISLLGNKITFVLQGDMGNGKSATLTTLGEKHPKHRTFYCDCTTKDVGDLMLPMFSELDQNGQFVRFVTNEELGVHIDGPVIIMVDEFGKANRSVQNALLCLMYERKMGSRQLHPDSMVYATTNLGAEAVGDLLQPHQRNRFCVLTVKKWTNEQWMEWAINNQIDPQVILFAKENPEIFQSFTEVENPDDNQYIYHPKVSRAAFVTPRSLETASHICKVRDQLGADTTTALLIGCIGEHAARQLNAQFTISDDLVPLDDIKNSPKSAKIPSTAAAQCMMMYRTLSNIDRSWIDAWMDYMDRLPANMQGMFVNGVYSDKFDKKRQQAVVNNKKFTDFTMANGHLSAADKKSAGV